MWAFTLYTLRQLYVRLPLCSFAAGVHRRCSCNASSGAVSSRRNPGCALKCLRKRKPHHSQWGNQERLLQKFTADPVQHDNEDAPFVFVELIFRRILCSLRFPMICITDVWYSECIALTVKASVKLSFFDSFQFSVLFQSIKDSVNHILNVLSNNFFTMSICVKRTLFLPGLWKLSLKQNNERSIFEIFKQPQCSLWYYLYQAELLKVVTRLKRKDRIPT